MSTGSVDLEADLAALLQEANQPIQRTARELIVLELYRRGAVSGGKAAERLGMDRWDFICYASRLGIAFYDMMDEEWQSERTRVLLC